MDSTVRAIQGSYIRQDATKDNIYMHLWVFVVAACRHRDCSSPVYTVVSQWRFERLVTTIVA